MDVEVIAFDVFGTLVDWRSGIAAALARVGGQAGIDAEWPLVADAWRSLYRPTLEQVVRGKAPFQPLDVLHRLMLDQVAREHGLDGLGDEQRDELVRAWYRLTPWPDVVPGLTTLRERHILTPLSNGGFGLLARLARSAGLPFDCIISAELASAYKPDPRTYQLVPAFFGIPPERVLMVACHPADLDGAARSGLRTAFIPRPKEWGPATPAQSPPSTVDIVADDMIALAAMAASW